MRVDLLASLFLVLHIPVAVRGQPDSCPLQPGCCEEDCCGPDTEWFFPRCVSSPGAPGFDGTYSPEHEFGCVVRECCEENCCGWLTIYDPEIRCCVPLQEATRSPSATLAPTHSPTSELPTDSAAPSAVNQTKKVCVVVYSGRDTGDRTNAYTIWDEQEFQNLAKWKAIQDDDVVTWYYRDRPPDVETDTEYNLYNVDAKKFEDKVKLAEKESDSKASLQAFLTHALKDCKSKGTKEAFIILHGHGGESGYGWNDDRPGADPAVSSITHPQVAMALSASYTASGQDKDKVVLGFNTCGVKNKANLKTYTPVSKHFLAAPVGTTCINWIFFDKLADAECALDMAKEVKKKIPGLLKEKWPNLSGADLQLVETASDTAVPTDRIRL